MATDLRGPSPLGGLLRLRPAGRRWPLALRVSVSSAIPVLVGWMAGDVGAGLIAALGAFTCDYASDRPYFNRAVQSGAVAVALAAAITLGAWAAATAWIAVLVVSLVAIAAVWFCSALDVGPPGAYMFVLVCAVGVGVSASHLPAWQIGLLVFGGGVLAWTAQMSAVLAAPRGPEKTALAAAGDAVADFLVQPDTAAARHRAAQALAQSWSMLVDYQPRRAWSSAALWRLRDSNHALHVLFIEAMRTRGTGQTLPDGAAATARGIGRLQVDPAVVSNRNRNRAPLPPAPARARLIRAVRPGAHTRRVMVRVAVAVPLAGVASTALGLGHRYWAMAAALLVLHQGVDRVSTLQRGTERVIGTFLGLGLAAVILGAHPQGLSLVVLIAVLQFAVEMFIVRNYAIAAVFITATALTIASGAQRVDVGRVVVDRGLDTLVGCGVAVAVYLLAVRRQEVHRISEAISAMVEQVRCATAFLADGDMTSLPARAARRDLQDRIFDLTSAAQAARSGSRRDRVAAVRLDAAVVAAEQLGYATVAACWAAENSADTSFIDVDARSYRAVLQQLSYAARARTVPVIAGEVPSFAAGEVSQLAEALRQRALSE